MVAASLALLLVVGGGIGVAYTLLQRDDVAGPVTSEPTGLDGDGGGTSPTRDPETPSPTSRSTPTATTTSASPSATPRLATPDDALGLSGPAAAAELLARVQDDQASVVGLAGSWVPQVSSKCPGLAVDLGPGWVPDGSEDTPAVSEQQILGFTLAMEQRYGTVTTTAAALGVDSMPSSCNGASLWISLVPERFVDPDRTLAWCDQNGLPVDECGARLVVAPGQTGTELRLRDG